MSEEPVQVMKTLVVGLGSTGAEICDLLAERVEWELGHLERAPWMRFLCIETNANQPTRFRNSSDFVTLSIGADEYERMVRSPELYDESVLLTKWIDRGTIAKLPGNEVSAGAGNIRMVGRLAFLCGEYAKVKRNLVQRIEGLRALTEAEATERRGTLTDGSNPPIEFASDGHLRIIIAGTFCGGTCSGLAGDFGFFLKTLCQADDKLLAIFSLPRPDLTPALLPAANRYKKNAYVSLTELNHYHLADRRDESPIRYPDGVVPDTSVYPYDIVFLALPRSPQVPDVEALNTALAERIFLNVFVPETDPFAAEVDAPVFDRDNRAHVFCSFGLSTLEFPAYQVIEACSKRLIAHALREWQHRAHDESEIERRLEGLGLTWSGLSRLLLQTGSADLQHDLDGKMDEVLRMAHTAPALTERSLSELRAMLRERIPDAVRRARASAANAVLANLRNHVQATLLEYDEGPHPLGDLLRAAAQRLDKIRGAGYREHREQAAETDRTVRALRVCQSSVLLRFFLLRRRAIGEILPTLRRHLREEVQRRVDSEVANALQSRDEEPGLIERLQRLLKPVQDRVDNLSTRITRVVTNLSSQADSLSRNAPRTNGLSIFQPETAEGGTVRSEYRACLEDAAGELATPWEVTQNRLAADVIRAWDTLPDAIVPRSQRGETDWLLQPLKSSAELDAITSQDLRRLERKATEPFARLAQVDVLERWRALDGAAEELRGVAAKATPFLQVDRVLAEAGHRSPVQTRRTTIAPESQYRAAFLEQARRMWTDTRSQTCPDRFRAILLEEWYRFPLSGTPDVLEPGGLCDAECDDWPNFHTRIDIFWRGLAGQEVTAARRAEELVTVGILIGELEARHGHIILKWPKSGFGEEGERHLPLSLRGAVGMLAREDRECANRPLTGALSLLENRLASFRKGLTGSAEEAADAFVRRLDEELRAGVGAEIPEWDREQVASCLMRYCAADSDLWVAYSRRFQPDPATLDRLRKKAGDNLPNGRTAKEDGLYCSTCGGFIGRDERDAARNGWKCYVHPQHYFGPSPPA